MDTISNYEIKFNKPADDERVLFNLLGIKPMTLLSFYVESSILKAAVKYEDGGESKFSIDLFYYQLAWSENKAEEELREDLRENAKYEDGENNPSLGYARDWLIKYICP